MTYYESSDKGHEEMSYCESSEESLSYDKLSGYFLVLPGLTRFLNIKKKKKISRRLFLETGGHESHTFSQQIVSILPWTELGEEKGLPYKEFLEPTAPELLDFPIKQAYVFFR